MGDSVDFDALANELRRGATNESCFDLYGESEGSGMASACRGRQPRQPEGAPVPDLVWSRRIARSARGDHFLTTEWSCARSAFGSFGGDLVVPGGGRFAIPLPFSALGMQKAPL